MWPFPYRIPGPFIACFNAGHRCMKTMRVHFSMCFKVQIITIRLAENRSTFCTLWLTEHKQGFSFLLKKKLRFIESNWRYLNSLRLCLIFNCEEKIKDGKYWTKLKSIHNKERERNFIFNREVYICGCYFCLLSKKRKKSRVFFLEFEGM